MRMTITAAVVAGILLASGHPVSAAHHRHHHQITTVKAVPASTFGAGPIAGAAARYLGGNPTGLGHNWCGIFMGMMAKAVGITPPSGYSLAANWQHFGHSASGPAPGEIAILRGGHHVGVVLAVVDGGRGVLVRSGNHGHRVGDGVYPVHGAQFRIANQ